jgi:hypothetical protein
MARRNLRDNASCHHFVGDFAPRPVADRTLLGLLTSQRDHLACLLCRDLRRPARAWGILKPVTDRKILQRNGLQTNPAHSPTAHGIRFYSQFPPDVCIVLALGRPQNHAPSQRDLPGGAVPTHQVFQRSLLSLMQHQLCWFGTTHLLCSFVFVDPILPHADLRVRVLVACQLVWREHIPDCMRQAHGHRGNGVDEIKSSTPFPL